MISAFQGCDYFFPPLRADKVTVQEASNFISNHIGDSQVILLDIRSKNEFDSLSIDNSVNLDFSRPDFPEMTEKLDKDRRYIIIDENGKRSAMAFELMKEQRFTKIHYIIGGMDEWVKFNLPVKK
ncbi:MAG: rhodanese-like domain-containing protein [Ignavibacteria bacterium]